VLREVAEYPNSFGPLGPNDERIVTGRFTLCMGQGRSWNTVQRQRFAADEVDAVLEEVRSLLQIRGRTRTQWEVGSSAQPPDLVDLLLERGLVRVDDPYAVASVLTASPPPSPPGIVARRVETFDEYAAANDVQLEAFGASRRRGGGGAARRFPSDGATRRISCTPPGWTASWSPQGHARRLPTGSCCTAARPRCAPAAAAPSWT